jgi:glycosyltransferase involved in cell wall biosynthesis
MVILTVTETLAVGGAETFLLRLANRLAKDHTVVLVNLHPEYSHPDLVAQLDERIEYRTPKLLMRTLRQKLDGGLLRLRIEGAFLARALVHFLTTVIREVRPDVVHSHLFKTDYYVALARSKGLPIFNHVITMHGDYLSYERSASPRILQYQRKLQKTLRSIDCLVTISEEQMLLLNTWGTQGLKFTFKVRKILNGYENNTPQLLERKDIGLEEHDFVFGMVARGIPKKGWGLLIDAFLSLNRPNTKLVLVGAGSYLDALRAQHRHDNRIHFTGFTPNPLAYIQLFDVGVLPSLFKTESLPTVVTEYLYCGKAVISTDVGEVRNMLRPGINTRIPIAPDEELAGQLVPFPSNEQQPDPRPLCNAMQRYATDSGLLSRHQEIARLAFRKFDMGQCVEAYLNVYETACE